MTKILIFDVDGTLLLTGGAGRIAFEKAFEELFGVREVWGNLIPDGKTDPAIIDEIAKKSLNRRLDSGEYAALCEHYLSYFESELVGTERFHLMPGVYRLIESLSKDRVMHLGIATGNFEDAAWKKLEKGRLRSFFSFGGFGSDSRERFRLTQIALKRGKQLLKESVPDHQVYVIGDTVHDVTVGKRLGVRTIGIATGRTSWDELGAYKPDHLLPGFQDRDAFWKCLD